MMSVSAENEELVAECTALGAAVLAAQRVEFLLYGLVAHFKDEIKQADKRHRNLTPERFLRGDLADLRATLGQLAKTHGDQLLLSPDDLDRFVKNRNRIVHDYWRLAKANIRGGPTLEDPMQFLIEFLKDCRKWEGILKGVLVAMADAVRPASDGRSLFGVDDDATYLDEYLQHLQTHASPGKPDPA